MVSKPQPGAVEEILEPDLPIIDTHHHLWMLPEATLAAYGKADSIGMRQMFPIYSRTARYLLDDFMADVRTGHNIVGTVFLEAHSMYRVAGPPEMKSVGEVEFANGSAAMCAAGNYGNIRVAAGIVGGGINLMELGDAVKPVLEAHKIAGGRRYAGIRAGAIYDEDVTIGGPGTPHMLAHPKFRQAFRHLAPLGLSCDVFIWEPQMMELADLARAFPDTQIILNHLGAPLAVGRFAGKRAERFPHWCDGIRALAKCPNVNIKLGGIGMLLNDFDYKPAERDVGSQQMADDWKPYIETAIEAFGANRCMFESNYPVDSATASYAAIWNAFKRVTAGASKAEKEALYKGTAMRVYKLDLS
jgi:predicted TIM-barrel fold metal-dependent hydrolase